MFFGAILLWGALVCAEHSGLVMIGHEEEFKVLREDKPKPVCDGNGIGVGIDLSTTYGTVAIKYPNKTVVDVGKIALGPIHSQLMQSFYGHRVPDNFIRPPGSGPFWPELYLLSLMRRERRKSLGRPSTSDVSVLSDSIQRLYDLAQASTNQPLPQNVLVSTPYLLNLGPQDLDDALEYIGLTNLHSPSTNAYNPAMPSDMQVSSALSQAAASYAGLGLGLCEHWQDYKTCEEEEKQMMRATEWGPTGHQILQITYTKSEFAIDEHYVNNKVESSQEVGFCYQPRLDLGFDAALKNESIWGVIKEEIVRSQWTFSSPYEPGQDTYPDAEMWGPHGINGIILTGESAQEESFLRVLKEALEEMSVPGLYDEMVWWKGLNVTMGAARGVAVLAERWVWKACEEDGAAYLDEETVAAIEVEEMRIAEFESVVPYLSPANSIQVNEETLKSAKMELV